MQELITYLIPVIVASVSQPLYEWMQEAFRWLDNVPAWIKPIIFALVTFGGTKLTVFLGVAVSVVDPTQWTAGDVGAIAAAGLGAVLHVAYKQRTS